MPCDRPYHDCLTINCETCEELMYWVVRPTGGRWKHVDHPSDSHDGESPAPEHPDGLFDD